MQYYFLLQSTDSPEFYKENRPCKFMVKLYSPLYLEGAWEAGLTLCRLSPTSEEEKKSLPNILLVQTPLCGALTVLGGKTHLPILQPLSRSEEVQCCWEFPCPAYKPVEGGFVETIEVNITSEDGVSEPFKTGKSLCMLHLREKTRTT